MLGVAALMVKARYGEVKSMFTAPVARNRGVGTALLETLTFAARAEGLVALKLETGTELGAACRLYTRHGFRPCGAFGGYSNDGASVFMEKPLA